MRRTLAAALVIDFLIGALLAPAAVAAAPTGTVVDCGAGADLQAAINAALPGAALTVRGTCVGTFVIHQDLTLVGRAQAKLDARGSGTTLAISSPSLGQVAAPQVSITDLAITGGTTGIEFSGESGGNLPLGSLSMLSSDVTGNGVGIASYWGAVSLQKSTVSGNSAGGIVTNTQSQAYLDKSTVSGNTGFGVKVQEQGSVYLDKSTVRGTIGAGIVVSNAVAWIEDSTVRGNTAGGIFMPGRGYLTVRHSTIAANTVADYGGGIYIGPSNPLDTEVTIEDSTIRANTAGISGGGIYNEGPSLTLTNVKFRNNTPDDCFGC